MNSGNATSSDPARLTSILRKPIRAQSIFGGGIIWREARAASSAMLALAGFDLLIVVLGEIRKIINEQPLPAFDEFNQLWIGTGIVAALCLGVLCGAEEEENQTADFTRRLPLPRWRILLEKLIGCGVAFLTWTVVSIVGMWLITKMVGGRAGQSEFQIFLEGKNIFTGLTWSVLLFSAGLAGATWLRKVLPGAVVGGVIGAGTVCMVNLFAAPKFRLMSAALAFPDHVWPLWTVSLILIAIAAFKFQTREGR